MLDSEQQASFLPLLSASKNPQTLYISSPPDESSDGDVFRRIRETGKSGESSSTSWNEWGVDDVGDVADRKRWQMAIPSLGYLINESTVESELEQMEPVKFAVERLGLWVSNAKASVIPRNEWGNCATEEPPMDGITCFAVKFSPDGSTVSVCAALRPRESGVNPHFELVHHRDTSGGIGWLVTWLAQRAGNSALIVIDGLGSAENLRDRLFMSGVNKRKVSIPRPGEVATANAAFLDAIRSESVTYYQDEDMDAAAHGCTRRKIGTSGGWGFQSTEDADASILEAAALALWAVTTTKRDPNRKARIG